MKKRDVYISQDGFFTAPVRRLDPQIFSIMDIISDARIISKRDCFICGGYARWACSTHGKPTKAGDVDIYSESEGVYNYVRKRLEARSLKMLDDNPMATTFEYTPNIQLIKPVNKGAIVARGTMKEVLSNFDFTVIRAGIISPMEALLDRDFPYDEEHHILRIKNIHCPISSMLRCMKYAKKGYFIQPSEAMKLFDDWMNRDEGYRDEIITQLKEIANGAELTQEQIEHLEVLMRID